MIGTMDALVLHAIGDARFESVPIPSVPPGWVRVRVGYCGVCGSDLPRIFVKGTYHYPTICGHEFAGTVETCDDGIDDLNPGDAVAVFPLLWCGKCGPCERGQYVQCENYDYLGSRRDGGLAEYICAPRQNLLRVPAGVSLEEASMIEPAAVSLHAVRRGRCSVDDIVVVFGAGPIGLMVAQWARIMGASRVIVFDLDPRKLDLAKSIGFSDVHNSRDADPLEVIGSLTGGEGAHLCIEAVGVPATAVQSLQSARRGGRVVLLGNPSGEVSIPTALISQLMRREIEIFGTWNSNYSACCGDDDWSAALRAMESKALDVRPLISHEVPLSESWDILQKMQAHDGYFCKVLIHP